MPFLSPSRLNIDNELPRQMESPTEMIEDLKEIGSVLGVNFAAVVLSLSEIEQTVRIVGGVTAIAYTLIKIHKLIHK